RRRASVADDLNVDTVGIDMQPIMPLALAGDQAYLFAAIAVGHLAAEDCFDHPALPAVQDHGRRDDAARADRIYPPGPEKFREQVNRMRVAEHQQGLPAEQRQGKLLQVGLIHLQSIEIGGPFQYGVAEPPAPATLQVFRIPPDHGNALAEAPAAPLV